MKTKTERICLAMMILSLFVAGVMTGAALTFNKENRVLTERVESLEKLIPFDKHIGGELRISYQWPFKKSDYLAPTSPFGERESLFAERYSSHTGIDLLGLWHARVVSIADGIVTVHYLTPGEHNDRMYRGHPIYGAMITIRHDDGSESLYAHLSETFVHEGMRVKTGQIIGRQGATGQCTGEHLHLELRIDGILVNPLMYLEK